MCLNDDTPLCVLCANYDESEHMMHTVVKVGDCVQECERKRQSLNERVAKLGEMAGEQLDILEIQKQ